MDDHREKDLFGNPVRARKGLRGRPSKQMTDIELDMLEAGLVKGWSNERIARVLGIGLSTLKRNFGPLLKMRNEIPDRLELVLFAATIRKGLEKGDVGALRLGRQLIAEERLGAITREPKDDEETERAEEPIGKKELQRRAAKDTVENDQGDWGGDLRPGFKH